MSSVTDFEYGQGAQAAPCAGPLARFTLFLITVLSARPEVLMDHEEL
jgi:hypothetical protein